MRLIDKLNDEHPKYHMSIRELMFMQDIQNYKVTSVDLLKKIALYISVPEFIFIPYFVRESNLNPPLFLKAKTFIYQLCDEYFKFHNYNQSEKAWYKFYTLLQIYKEPPKDTDLIYEEYDLLPPLESNNLSMQWIQYQVKNLMIDFYSYLNFPLDQLIQEIEDTPQEVREFSA